MSNGRSGHRYCLHSVTVDPAIDHGWFVPVGLLFLVLWLASAVGLMAAFYLVYRPGTKLIEVLVDGSVNMRSLEATMIRAPGSSTGQPHHERGTHPSATLLMGRLQGKRRRSVLAWPAPDT
jgi:hypothetical protein